MLPRTLLSPVIHWISSLLPFCSLLLPSYLHPNTMTCSSHSMGTLESLPLHQVGPRREGNRLQRTGLTQQSDEPLLCTVHFCCLAFQSSFLCFLSPVVGKDIPFCFSTLYIPSFVQESISTEVNFLCPISTFYFIFPFFF